MMIGTPLLVVVLIVAVVMMIGTPLQVVVLIVVVEDVKLELLLL